LQDDLQGSNAKLTMTELRLREQENAAKKWQDELRDATAKLTLAQTRLRTLETDAASSKKNVAAATRDLEMLQQENKALTEQVQRSRAALENRFEGILLTGRRVVFLVDMSGSMNSVEPRVPDPQKWVGVRETVAKVMRSLPGLEKFQVILFSDKVSYLLGEDGRWLDYDAKTSADRILNALAAIKPRGNTNMYTALEAAFRYRAQGLDTIYLLSDGLPNDGPGLPPNGSSLSETQQAEYLAKHIRKLLRGDWNRTLAGRPRVRINTIGFFYESPDVGAFLWALARENDGGFVGMSKP
jgi:Mg-chelatase subunit ChlD